MDPSRIAYELVWRLHRLVYRITGGRVGTDSRSERGTLLLRTVGRRSGRPRETMLYFWRDGPRYAVVASNLGSERPPAWFLNLTDHSEAEVEVDRRVIPVRATAADGAHSDLLWQRIDQSSPVYADYRRRASRTIPVVLLEPIT